MPFASTHILFAIVLVELYREYFLKNNRNFPRYYILIAAIGGLIPDLDLALRYILGIYPSRGPHDFLHNLFIPLILLLIGLLVYYSGIKSYEARKRHIKISTIFFIFAATSLIHLILDSITASNLLLWPVSNIEMGFNLIKLASENMRWLILPVIDGILLLFWLFWLEFKLKVTDYF